MSYRLCPAALLIALAGAPAVLAHTPDLTNGFATTTLVITGGDAPGIPGGVVSGVQRPILNRRGDVIFRGGIERIVPDSIVGTRTLWHFDDATKTTRLVMTNAEGVAGFTPTAIAPDGTVYYLAIQADQRSWLSLPDGTDEEVALPGTPAPGVPGALFGPSFNAIGQGQARSFIDSLLEPGDGVDTTNNRGIWRRDEDGSLTLVMRSGDLAPETGGAVIGTAGIPVISSSGEGVSVVTLRDGVTGSVDETNDTAIYAVDAEGKPDRLLLRDGDVVQGTDGATIESISFPFIDSSGRIVLRATYVLDVGDSDDTNNLALLTGNRDTGFTEFWRRGDGLPGMPELDIDRILGSHDINDQGQVLVRGELNRDSQFVGSGNDLVLLVTDGTTTTLALREGDEVPGVPDARFIGISTNHSALNSRGDVVIPAALDGPGIDGFNNLGIWAYLGSTDELIEVIRSGQLFDVDDDPAVEDLRTVERPDLSFAPRGNTGQGTSLTDDGFFTATIDFTDGTTGLFRMKLPDPITTDGCRADFDRDADVDLGDFGAFAKAFGSAAGDPNYAPHADFDEDGDIDLGDFHRFAVRFGRTECFKD